MTTVHSGSGITFLLAVAFFFRQWEVPSSSGNFLTNYGLGFNKVLMYCDNKSVIALCCNNIQHSWSKHIDIRYHFIKEQVKNGVIELYFVNMEYQLADLFTKALGRDRIKFLINKLGMRSFTPETLKQLMDEVDEAMDTTIEHQLAMDEAFVPTAQRSKIGRRNFCLLSDIKSKESTLQLIYDVLRICPFFKAFLITTDVPEIYMQEFWATTTVHYHSIRFKMDNKKHIIDLEIFMDILHICPRIHGEAAPKPKASVRTTRSSSDTSITPLTAATSPRLTASVKGKQTAKASKAKSLSALSEVAMIEAQQLKLVTKRSKQQTHISQPSGSGTDEGTGSKQGILDVPTDESEEELSWNSTDNEGDDNEEKDDDGDEEDEGDDGEEGNGEAAPKPKASVRTTRSASVKGKQTAKASKAKSLSALSEVAMIEAQQLKLVTKRSKQQTHISQPSGSGTDEGTGSKQGILDVPTDESEEELSWNSTDNEGDDNEEKDDDGDEEDEGDDDDDKDDDEEGRGYWFKQDVNEQLEPEVLTRSSHSSRTFYAVAADLSEMELKKILIEKMEGNKSIQHSDEQRNLYKALVDAYESDKIILDTYGEIVTLKRRRDDDADKDKEPSAGPDRGSKRRREGKEPESASAPMKTATKSTGRVDTLTPELLDGPTYELMKGSCKSLIELEYHLEEVYKATTDQLDGVNPEGQQYPHNLLQPLPLIPNNRGHRVIPFEHFINNDLEYLRGGTSSRKIYYLYHEDEGSRLRANQESARDVYSKRRIIAVTKLKIVEWHSYKNLNWITVRRDDDKLYKFKDGDFKILCIQDIEDMLLLLVQGKLTNLTVEERFAFNVSLRMFTRSIKKDKRNRLMRIDELHKFSDRTLTDVLTALDDRLKGIRIQYLPQSIWRKSNKDRAAAMIQAIDKRLKTRRIMRSLERFVGGRLYEGDFRMLQRTI
nr:retrotransposon protein, putative, unclassified [Tanacetum cinerariifolium]